MEMPYVVTLLLAVPIILLLVGIALHLVIGKLYYGIHNCKRGEKLMIRYNIGRG